VINMRHYLMAATLAPSFRGFRRRSLALIAHLINDESFAVTVARSQPPDAGVYLGSAAAIAGSFVAGVLVGTLLGGLFVGAAGTLVALVRAWKTFWDDDFTVADRKLGMQVAVFVIPPIVVLLHELGHLLTAKALGVRVVGFHYGLFEGSVTATGSITAAQGWFIALAGNLVSIAVGLVLVGVGSQATELRPPVRYVAIMGGIVELVFGLVAYPLLSLSTSFGDWMTIYDFSATPVPSWATAAVHVALVVALWRWWQSRLRPTLFAVAYGEEERLAQRQRAVRQSPSDVEARIELANLFAGHGDLGLAAATLERAVGPCDGDARLHLARARIALFRGRWNEAVLAARDGLATTTADQELRQRLSANEGLALAQMQRPVEALAAFEHLSEPIVGDLRVVYARGVARLGAGDVGGGRADLQAVVDRLPESDALRAWAQARLQGDAPPTAPLAGV
jgi:hypothetical protein